MLERRQVVLHEAFGWSDMDRKTPLAPNTIVCVRSMTKPLVGTAIQMLIDEGKLRPSDAASKYLDSFDNDKSRAITIEQLLTHTAGFPLTMIDKPLRSYSGGRAVVDQAGKIGPSGKPGSFRYSDTDSETLAAIVSEVSGEPVDLFIQRRIIEPLGMKDTFCVLGNESPPRSRVSSNHAGAPGCGTSTGTAKPSRFSRFSWRRCAVLPPPPITRDSSASGSIAERPVGAG